MIWLAWYLACNGLVTALFLLTAMWLGDREVLEQWKGEWLVLFIFGAPIVIFLFWAWLVGCRWD